MIGPWTGIGAEVEKGIVIMTGTVIWDRNSDRYRERDRDRSRDLDRDRSRDLDRDRSRELEHDRDRSRDRDQDRERGNERARERDRTKDRFLDRDQDQHRDQHNEQEHNRERDQDFERDHDSVWERYCEMDRTNGYDKISDKDKDQQSKKWNGSRGNDHLSKLLSSDSSGNYQDQVKEQLERSIQRHDDLQNEICQMQEKLKAKEQFVLDLRIKAQKLEDALTTSKKLTSQRQMQLTKLHKCFLQVKDFSKSLKICEQELQSLVDTAMIEVDVGDDIVSRDAILTSGNG
ncbi:hypothetical protein L1049_000733 [Liquidambar formosana]|uniref:Uncharacterized protein n=1 Tax=Liquidambar formosana TaxID=63359 RepID=A0AAP0R7X8_LIQFO